MFSKKGEKLTIPDRRSGTPDRAKRGEKKKKRGEKRRKGKFWVRRYEKLKLNHSESALSVPNLRTVRPSNHF